MKLILFGMMILMSLPIGAQEAGSSNLYVITADNVEVAGRMRLEMESRFEVYNRLFRFDPSLLQSPLNVRVFGDKESYDSYVSEKLGEVIDGAVYIHYEQIQNRELVVYRSDFIRNDSDEVMLAHQAFVQYLRAFIPNPPSWFLNGFAVYFSNFLFDPQGDLVEEESLPLLESARMLGNRMPSLEAIFFGDEETLKADEFKIASWALVSFLLSGDRDYYRALAESFMLLSSAAATADENMQILKQRFCPLFDISVIEEDFRSHLNSRKTFAELMEEGIKARSLGDNDGAEIFFVTAAEQRPRDFAPHYYLGLIAFENEDYDRAENFYRASLERGGDEGLINYALGINAFAAGRSEDAVNHLHLAAGLDPSRFRTRAEELLRIIWR